MDKVFIGWNTDENKYKTGALSVKKNNVIKMECPISLAGIYIDPYNLIYFDDKKDKMEFLYNGEIVPEGIEPIIFHASQSNKIPKRLDGYTMECVRDIIYWWFEEYFHKTLSKKRKNIIAKIVGLHYDKKKYNEFINLNYNRPEYIEWLKEEIKKRK